ncbi:uncharacterized protein Eint_081210 [Encephalitozoon intestinalis ATCC 50506]|uniref:Uncharacterized protein n=1 Tax=Encephalitozoon intestinalis (strain ATCC 50506) TaxID=876142 RepID=E0S8T6_ENCIT|nr:uncharacterized protein Eint_081210 [Encephalitozoon intestinalis ATCC 50506]ADM12053.1 hypothetical protein Eint_081210 [Encephalitozoon intestinalis ATCC 50506]UTX45843.1 hypothetical protein GPK93_08g14220 [Encephalitozoon intestinalis]
MGARKNRMRGRGRIQGAGRSIVIERSEVKKEEKAEGKFNVDFQELNEELSGIELKEENSKCSDVDEMVCERVCKDDKVEEVPEVSEINRENTVDEEVEAEKKEENIENRKEEGEDAVKASQALYPATPSVLTTVIPQTPMRRVLHEEGSHLFVKEESMALPGKVIINRYPGHLFIHIDQVERFMTSRKEVESVSIKIESKGIFYETKKYPVQPDIGINEMLQVPINKAESNGTPLRFILLLYHRSGNIVKSCETVLVVDGSRIRSIHNNLLESRLAWDNYVSRNLFKSIRSFFTSGAPDAWSLKIYLSFVSDDELRLIPAPLPQDLKSLSKWLVVKKFSYNIWFRGFVNVRGDVEKACTNLWKRRYVRCYGYMIFIFNEHSRSLVGTINLVDASFDPSTSNKVYLENFLRINVGEKVVELHFDTKDKYNTCRSALTMMLPRTLFHKKG